MLAFDTAPKPHTIVSKRFSRDKPTSQKLTVQLQIVTYLGR